MRADGVVGLSWSNEIARDDTGSLMNFLVEGVLSIRAGLTLEKVAAVGVEYEQDFPGIETKVRTVITGPVSKLTLSPSFVIDFPFDSISPCWK